MDYLTDAFETSDGDGDGDGDGGEGLVELKVTICSAGWEGSSLYWLLSNRSSQWAAPSITLRSLRMEWNNLQRKRKKSKLNGWLSVCVVVDREVL